jgi:hypothetical protein
VERCLVFDRASGALLGFLRGVNRLGQERYAAAYLIDLLDDGLRNAGAVFKAALTKES